jgi:hypothetical protein
MKSLKEEINKSRKLMGLSENEDIDFLSTHWKYLHKKLDDIGKNIKERLSIVNSETETEKISPLLSVVKSSNLGDDWKLSDNKSKTLKALADKIDHMIHTGKSDSIMFFHTI